MLIGFYSPEPQSGKSTVTKILSEGKTLRIFKVSGAMKAMCAVAITDFVDDLDAHVDGALKDTPINTLTSSDLAKRVEIMSQALIDSSGGQLLKDENDTVLTLEKLSADLLDVFVPAINALTQNRGITARDIQKVLGLEWGRKLYGMDFWLKPLAAAVETSQASLNIIDDARFPDDAHFVKDRQGIMVKIIRPNTEKPDDHASEGLLDDFPFDVVLVNDADLGTLKSKVEDTLIPLLSL